jgi:hypothetical protein
MPSKSGLLTRFAIAAIVGAILTVCVIMPAEYRKDPTGFGRLTGLLELTTPRVATTPTTPAAAETPIGEIPPADATAEASSGESKLATDPTANHPASQPFKSETVQIPIGPDGELEYKAVMKAGQTIVYSWETDKGSVYFDFHGEPADPKNSKRYLEVQETKSNHGSFTAPFDGKHGWYFLNLTSENIIVTLKLSGFYQSHDYVK